MTPCRFQNTANCQTITGNYCRSIGSYTVYVNRFHIIFRAKLIPAKKKMGDKVPKKIRKKAVKPAPPSDEDSEPEPVSTDLEYNLFE